MENREKLCELIENLNESGLEFIMTLLQRMDESEEYNKNTTPERIEELKQMEVQERIRREERREKERERIAYEEAIEEYNRQREYKKSLTGREKHLFDVLDNVKIDTRYHMSFWEVKLFSEMYNNNLFNGMLDVFRYGYIKGQRYECARRKKVQA